MRSPGLVVMSAVAVAVGAYAIFTLVGSDREAPERVTPSPAVDRGEDEPAPRQPSPRAGGLGIKPAPVTKTSETRRRGGPPPRPEPSVSLEQAREDFQAFLEELDRVKQAGQPLTTAEWTEYYKKGSEALLPLQQHLSWNEPGQGEELQRANEDLRTKLQAIEPRGPAAAAP